MTGSGDRTEPTSDELSTVERDPTIRFSLEGETVAATRYQPIDLESPNPAVLWITPYDKDDITTWGRYDPLLEYIAAHGYEVTVADLIGTGASSGHRAELFGPDMGEEVAEIINCLADQPWTTDRVGLIGKSFPGATCLAAAAEQPDPLAAIMPIMTSYRRRAFAFAADDLANLSISVPMLAVFLSNLIQPPTRRDAGWEDIWQSRLHHIRQDGPPMFDGLVPDPSDPRWEWRISVENIEVPTFVVGGYRDHFPVDTLDYFEAINGPKRLLMGPWRHVIPYQGRESAIDFRRQAVDWFDHHLKEESRRVEEPSVDYWTQRDGGREVDSGIWRRRPDWPTVNTESPLTFVVTPDGLRTSGAFDTGTVERSYELDHTVGVEAQDSGVQFVDTNADDARSLTFETSAFDEPVELTGTGEAIVQLTADGVVPVCVRLVDLAPSGRARPITQGAVRVDHPVGDAITVPLTPVSHILEAGHRLRIAISGADFPTFQPIGDVDSFTVSSTPSESTAVRLPGTDPWSEPTDETITMQAPDDALPSSPSTIEEAENSVETIHEHTTGHRTRRSQATTRYSFPHVEKTYAINTEFSVNPEDPATLSAHTTVQKTLEYDQVSVSLESTVRLEGTSPTASAKIQVDGEDVFDEKWSG